MKNKILIIDDEESICDACSEVYIKDGHKVEIAKDGETGLKKVIEFNPDIVLVDLKMPGISGMEVLEELKKTNPDIVSIVITGYATIDSAVEVMKKGAFDFLPKPFTPDELRVITNRAIEKRESIKELNRFQKMREAFISMVSHQLKTPLVAVRQYLEVILGGMTGEINEEQKEILDRSKIRIDGLLKLIKDWLNLSRIDENKIVDKLRPIKLYPIINKILDLLKLKAEEKNVSINIDIPENLPMISGDSESLEQAFLNLIDNGIRFNKEGGSLSIKAKSEDEIIVVDISDTGIGIQKEKIPYIFEQFYQVKDNKIQNIEGTGLGLSIVKKIIDAHTGTVNIESEPGKGSTFSVILPQAK